MNVKIRENSFVAYLGAKKLNTKRMAMVIGNTIHLYNTSRKEFLENKSWVCHELTHINQFKENGFAKFIWKYLIEWSKKGYEQNQFEVEARSNEHQYQMMEEIHFV